MSNTSAGLPVRKLITITP